MIELDFTRLGLYGFLLTLFTLFIIYKFGDYILDTLCKRNRAPLKHIVIFGGSKGIGLELAKLMAERNLKVSIIARNKSDLETARLEIKDINNCSVVTYSLDVVTCDQKEVEIVFERAILEQGDIDTIINCIGYAKCGLFKEISVKEHHKMLVTNFFSSVKIVHAILRFKQKDFSMIFMSSICGQFGFYGYSGYSPAKFAIDGLSQVLSMEYPNIHFMVVYPPDTKTPGYEVEEKTKSEITKKIGGTASLYSPQSVAKHILNGILRQDKRLTFGFVGYIMGALTAGTNIPNDSILDLFVQLFLMGLLRLIFIFNLMRIYKMVDYLKGNKN